MNFRKGFFEVRHLRSAALQERFALRVFSKNVTLLFGFFGGLNAERKESEPLANLEEFHVRKAIPLEKDIPIRMLEPELIYEEFRMRLDPHGKAVRSPEGLTRVVGSKDQNLFGFVFGSGDHSLLEIETFR